MNFCSIKNMNCEYSNENGYCRFTGCINDARFNNTHTSSDIIYNLTTEPKREDGMYIQPFIIKNGKRYDMKEVYIGDVYNAIRGYWKYNSRGNTYCSECYAETGTSYEYEVCPNCGVCMDTNK